MLILRDIALSEGAPCPYISGNTAVNRYFFALHLDGSELDALLEQGWRKFGYYFFRPDCPGCVACVPLRVPTEKFTPDKTGRRILRKNSRVEVRFEPLRYADEIYHIYGEHSMDRFGLEASSDDFIMSFYQQSCPSIQSEYYLDGRLMAVGYLDKGNESLSSVYFIYRTAFNVFSPGNFSILREIEYARSIGLHYYYLGYYIKENSRMAYKAHVRPHEIFLWDEKKWVEHP